MKTRLRYIDFEKGICILLVIYIHLTFAYNRIPELWFLHRLCIPQFALLAGYNMAYVEKRNTIQTILSVLGRMISIYFIALVLTQICAKKLINMEEIINTMISGGVLPYSNLPIWYVPHYMSLFPICFLVVKLNYLISTVVEKYFNKKDYFSYEFLIFASIILALIGFAYEGEIYYYVKQSLILSPFVILGFIINKIDTKVLNAYELDNKRKITINIILATIFVVSLVIFIVATLYGGQVDILPLIFGDRILFYLSTMCGGICLFIASKFLCSIMFFDALTCVMAYIGRKSLYLCCFTLPIQEIVFKRIGPYMTNIKEASAIDIFIKMLVSVVAAIAFSYVFERDKNAK